jgi:hypothetical protein
MKKLATSLALIALIAVAAPVAHAQDAAPAATDPGHPRVNQVDQRLDNQQQRIDNGVKDSQINAKQEMRDDKTDAHVSQELSKDEAKNGGHITKAEQTKMNRQLNHNNHRIHAQRVKAKAAAAPGTGTVAQ